MERSTDQLFADLRRVRRRISRIESALLSEATRERQIERRRAARLKFVVGGDVVGRAERGESDATAALDGARERARERDQTLFDGRVPTTAQDAAPPPADDTEPATCNGE